MTQQIIVEQQVRTSRGYVEQHDELRSTFVVPERFKWRLANVAMRDEVRRLRAEADERVLAAFWQSEAAAGFPVGDAEQERQRQIMALTGALAVQRHVAAYTAPQTIRLPMPQAAAETTIDHDANIAELLEQVELPSPATAPAAQESAPAPAIPRQPKRAPVAPRSR